MRPADVLTLSLASCICPMPLRSAGQKLSPRVHVCEELCHIASDSEAVLSGIITVDESWTYGMTLRQSGSLREGTAQTPSHRDRKARQVTITVKSSLISFYDVKGRTQKELFLASRTVNSTFCCKILRRLRGNLRRILTEILLQKDPLLHNENAPFFSPGIAPPPPRL
jgi:hypothetical protein